MEPEQATNFKSQHTMLPTVLSGFLQPEFPAARVFTSIFLNNCLVFVKTGSFGTNMAGTMQATLGGYTPTGLIAKAIGSIVDFYNAESRAKKTSDIAGFSPENMVAAHKRNFMLLFDEIKSVEIKGPNFAGEVKVVVSAGKTHKFRIDRQSKESTKYIERVFNEFLPGKIVRK